MQPAEVSNGNAGLRRDNFPRTYDAEGRERVPKSSGLTMDWNAQKVRENIQKADTDDLIDRVTAYRAGMEPEAIDMIEWELRGRGIQQWQIDEHRAACEAECLYHVDGAAIMCSLCRRPAVVRRWGWHRLWGMLPIFMRPMYYCREHAE
jgi:hypothetical protein